LPVDEALSRLRRLKERRDPIVLPEPTDIQFVIGRAPGRFAALVEAAWRTGCRLSELVSVERAKLDHTRRQLTVRGKGNKVRVIDLDFGGAYELLRKLPVHLKSKWLFCHHDGEPYRNVSSRFAAMVGWAEAAAGKEGRAFHPFTYHHLRHRHAVDWLKSGRSIYDLQQRLGRSR
jgi:integrase/recombinase XerD